MLLLCCLLYFFIEFINTPDKSVLLLINSYQKYNISNTNSTFFVFLLYIYIFYCIINLIIKADIRNPLRYLLIKLIKKQKRGTTMKLWGGRFTKETDQLVHNFNASLSFDQKFFKEDIEGSIAHVTMLAKQAILTPEEKDTIINGLFSIKEDMIKGSLLLDESQEDIHSFVEATLIERIGDAGKKLHTGRSRNDQVALDMKLYTRNEINSTKELLIDLLSCLNNIMKDNLDTYMPGFTHLQKAQPTTLSHHAGAYFEMFKRDY
ncbi:MAG: argininosuccinate lyase, partial [Anaerocolumna sp.]|nr:argininosuccinate lyase [Anaerocolumna sp.]